MSALAKQLVTALGEEDKQGPHLPSITSTAAIRLPLRDCSYRAPNHRVAAVQILLDLKGVVEL